MNTKLKNPEAIQPPVQTWHRLKLPNSSKQSNQPCKRNPEGYPTRPLQCQTSQVYTVKTQSLSCQSWQLKPDFQPEPHKCKNLFLGSFLITLTVETRVTQVYT